MTAEAPARTTDAAAAGVARVERERVTDHVTGLPILRYRFAGPATLGPGTPMPAGAWRVLRIEEREGRTTLDLETASGAEPLHERPAAIDDGVVDAALATLRRARAAGAVHGDLGPQRLWRRGEQVWIEGYGVRWRDDADAASDARDLAAGLLAVPGSRLSQAARARLHAIQATGDVDATPPPQATPDGNTTRPAGPGGDSSDTRVADPDGPTPKVVRGPPPGSLVRRGGIGLVALVARDAQQRWGAAAAATAALGERWRASDLRRPARAAPATLVGDAEHGSGLRPETRTRLAIVLLLATIAWVALASWGQRAPPNAGPDAGFGGRVVEVAVEPPGQPPVGLIVVASPPGSTLAPGAMLGSVPGKVWLDLDGRWSFEARFGDRRSPTVDLIVPFERVLQLAFPSPAAP